MESFELKEIFSVSPKVLYDAWLNSKKHTDMTGGKAVCSSKINGRFSAWDGYITGFNLALEPDKKIVQSWRTTEFSESDSDSELIIQFSPTEGGCVLTLNHNNIPAGQPDYKQGWVEYYFEPMKEYFK